MKKLIFVLTALALVLLLSVYLLIPDTITLKCEKGIAVTQQGLHRMLLDGRSKQKWWPGSYNDSRGFTYNGYSYEFFNNNISLLAITISGKEKKINSSLYIISPQADSVQLAWLGTLVSSYNPIKRINTWLKAKSLQSDMNMIIKKMESFYSNDENIYGIMVQKALVKDSLLIATAATNIGYPDTKFIYSLIDKLKGYANVNNAIETGYPMLNIETSDSIKFNIRVALPIDKALPGSDNIEQKRMPGGGNILVTEVKGGIKTALGAFNQIKKYADDYKRVPPAIPFYSLITDRIKEPDSSKWVTKIYFPVM